jgi:hypothetical protein
VVPLPGTNGIGSTIPTMPPPTPLMAPNGPPRIVTVPQATPVPSPP